jgi:L-rhamnonate dehydratase
MKITDIRLRELVGRLPFEGDFWEQRLVRPIDVYPEHKAQGADAWLASQKSADGTYEIRLTFIEIETDEGVTGIGGPITTDLAFIVDQQFRPLLIGEDPTANERIWDKMYREAVHGRKGPTMLAISAIDCAIWDLRGKWLNVPVYKLLGGPIRKSIPAYASALGFSLDPQKVHERASSFIADGYTATKWFPLWDPTDGKAGLRKILELAETLRDAIGEDADFMLDAWMSWSAPFTEQVANLIQHTNPRWLEEPVMPDLIDACAETRARSVVPIATGEHEYTRFGLKQLMDAGAADILQPDTYWAGGITEMMKIGALASTYGLPVIPHGHGVHANIHLSVAWPVPQVPFVEYLIKWQTLLQFFFKDKVKPINGIVTVPESPGLGTEIDLSVVDEERYLTFGDGPIMSGSASRR